MNTKLLSMCLIATAPRHAKRKLARFIYRGFFGTGEATVFLLMIGFMVGVGLMKLLSYWGV